MSGRGFPFFFSSTSFEDEESENEQSEGLCNSDTSIENTTNSM